MAVLLVMAGLVAAGFLVSRPAAPPEPLAGLIIEKPGLTSPTDAGLWYCAWAQSNAPRDSLLSIASMEPATATFTFPVAIPGTDPDTATLETVGPGASELQLSDIAQRGDSPFLIEFDNGPSAASVIVGGEMLAADACVSQGPDVWYFAGGSTMPGEELTLRIFNPYPETAKVTVGGVSEIGVEALGDFRSWSINANSWRDIDLSQELNSRQDLVISVTVDEGYVAPAMALRTEGDDAWWPGSGLAEVWEFPVVGVPGMEGSLVVSNPGAATVSVTVDLFTPDGPVPGAVVLDLDRDTPVRIPLSGLAGATYGARVTATGPVTAAVVAGGEGGLAITTGAAAGSRTWLLPGLRTAGLEEATLWLLNTLEDPVDVTVSILTGGGLVGETVSVEPGTVKEFGPVPEGGLGYLVDAPFPVTAAWSITSPTGIAYAAGLPVGDE
ncbi:MAG: hypothetical protein KJ698_03415 [Actinobacteria bacterium]|nr:hypothetical protein [Actinomycetota bacterium]MBU1493965.1 hypothetical protein [Actinomycetota bacterium]